MDKQFTYRGNVFLNCPQTKTSTPYFNIFYTGLMFVITILSCIYIWPLPSGLAL